MTLAAPPTVHARSPEWFRRSVAEPYPEWWLACWVGGAWLVLIAHAIDAPETMLVAGAAHGIVDAVAHALTMSVAMMLPLTVGHVRRAATTSLWKDRSRSAALFAGGFVMVWTPVAAVMTLGLDGLAEVVGRGPIVILTFGGAVMDIASRRRPERQQRCVWTMPLALHGRSADLDRVRYGVGVGTRSVRSCATIMLAATAAHGAVVMALVLAIELRIRSHHRLDLNATVRLGMAMAAVGAVAIVAT